MYKLMNKAVWIQKYGILVISDLHMGYEESLQIALPRNQYSRTIEDLKEIIEKVGKIKEIIILGDLKHEHGKILDQEWLEVSNLLDYLSGLGKVILIKGNHDKILEPIAEKKKIEIRDYYVKTEFGFIHGDRSFPELFDKKIKIIFMGHLHPSISIREDVKKEIYKCFLVGKYKKFEIVILPSFFPLIEGVDVTRENNNLAFDSNLDNFEVFIPTSDETFDFGKVKKVGKLV